MFLFFINCVIFFLYFWLIFKFLNVLLKNFILFILSLKFFNFNFFNVFKVNINIFKLDFLFLSFISLIL